MIVEELRKLIGSWTDDMEILARFDWPGHPLGEPPPDRDFRIAGVQTQLDPDTGDVVVMLYCDQQPE